MCVWLYERRCERFHSHLAESHWTISQYTWSIVKFVKERTYHKHSLTHTQNGDQQNYNNMINIRINWWRPMAINNNFIVPYSFGSAFDALTCLVFCGSRLVFCLSIVYGVIAQQIHRFCMENYDLEMLITFILRWKLEDISNRMTHNHRHGTTVWNGTLFFMVLVMITSTNQSTFYEIFYHACAIKFVPTI